MAFVIMFVLFISFKDSLIFLSDDSKLIFLAKISNEIFSSLLPKGNLTFIIILFFIFSIVSFLLSKRSLINLKISGIFPKLLKWTVFWDKFSKLNLFSYKKDWPLNHLGFLIY